MTEIKAVRDFMISEYERRLDEDRKLTRILNKISTGRATYKDAETYSYYTGKVASKVLKEQITAETYANLTADEAKELIVPVIRRNYQHVSKAASDVQNNLNKRAGIGMKSVVPDFDLDKADRLAEKFVEYEALEDAEFLIDTEVVTNSQAVVDEMLKDNAEFHFNAGLRPRIIRKAEAGCCPWCADLEGEYEYPGVPEDVFRRHNNCQCEVTYDPGTGRSQDVWSKAEFRSNDVADRISQNKALADAQNKRRLEQLADRKQRAAAVELIQRELHYSAKGASIFYNQHKADISKYGIGYIIDATRNGSH